MKFSDKTDKLLAALSAVQTEIVPPVKSREVDIPTKNGGKYQFRYADLQALMDCLGELPKKHGLILLQGPSVEPIGQMYGIFTRVSHVESGQWVEMFSEIDRKLGAQEQGGEQTTFRRHHIVAIFKIVPAEDGEATKPKAKTVTNVRNHAAPTVGKSAIRPPEQGQAANGDFNNFGGGGMPFNGRRG